MYSHHLYTCGVTMVRGMELIRAHSLTNSTTPPKPSKRLGLGRGRNFNYDTYDVAKLKTSSEVMVGQNDLKIGIKGIIKI